MEAIVLAGGLGIRLRQVVADVPKPMAPIAGRPFLEILLSSLAQKGFSQVVLALGYKAEQISSYFGPRFSTLDLIYTVEERPLGTGGAIRAALEKIDQDHVYVLNGDTYLDFEASALEQQWNAHKRQILVARRVPDTTRFGRLTVVGDRVTGFVEKGIRQSGLVNAGLYVLPRKALARFPPNQLFSIETDYFVHEVKRAIVNVFVTRKLFIDIGLPEDYARAQILLAEL